MRFPLQRLTACCLMAMYGLVGLTGKPLQYLADDFSNWLSKPAVPLAATGFYHRHGPGTHWHFHRHPIRATEHASKIATAASPRGEGYRAHRIGHVEHDCFLLTVLSTLELGAYARTEFFLDATAISPAAILPNSLSSTPLVCGKLARGPPFLSLA